MSNLVSEKKEGKDIALRKNEEECGYCGTSNDPNMICKDCFDRL